jgi:hypothetical protein
LRLVTVGLVCLLGVAGCTAATESTPDSDALTSSTTEVEQQPTALSATDDEIRLLVGSRFDSIDTGSSAPSSLDGAIIDLAVARLQPEMKVEPMPTEPGGEACPTTFIWVSTADLAPDCESEPSLVATVGHDTIVILVNDQNPVGDCLTFADLYAILGPEAEGLENWADGSDLADELGGFGDLPDQELQVAGASEGRGYDPATALVQMAFADFAIERQQPVWLRPDLGWTGQERAYVAQGTSSIGWFQSTSVGELEGVRDLQIAADQQSDCARPTEAGYPLHRPVVVTAWFERPLSPTETDKLGEFIVAVADRLKGFGYEPASSDEQMATERSLTALRP